MGSEAAGNTKLRSARQALGLRSQQQLAEAVTRTGLGIGLRISITERTVRRWESDNPPWPHPDHQAAIEHLFGRPITELGFTPPWAAGPSSGPQEDRPAAVPATAAASPLAMFPWRTLADPLPGSVAADYITVTAAHRHMYWAVPPAQLHRRRARQTRGKPDHVGSPGGPSFADRRDLRVKPAGRPHRVLRPAKPAAGTRQPGHSAPSGARCP